MRSFYGSDREQLNKAYYLLCDLEDEIELDKDEEKLYNIAKLCVSSIVNMIDHESFDPIQDKTNKIPDLIPQPEEVPLQCRSCWQHPSNGGTGVCNCTLGSTFSI